MSDDEIELLTSPIERRAVSRLFVIGGPLGLAIAIIVSLWVSHLRISDSVIVQTEPQWIPGESLALRVQLTPEGPDPAPQAVVTLEVEQGGERHPLPALADVGGGLLQGGVVVPSLTPGPATLCLHVEASPLPPRDERIELEIVGQRAPIEARHVVSTSMSQYADDSDPQPETHAIDLRPRGRVLAGFDNELWLRVTDAKGRPWSGPAAVRLVDGELGDARGDAEAPPLVWEGRTDEAGLASFHGVLSSEVLRLRVELRDEVDAAKVVAQRQLRLVSFAGAVHLRVDPELSSPGEAVEVLAAGLSAKRPVFVDVYDANGAWTETFQPPVQGREPPRPWTPPAGREGLLQLEAYHFTNEPGESTAVARLLVDPRPPAEGAWLRALVERQRATLSLPRNDRSWDEARERVYLDTLAARSLGPEAQRSARAWLVGTLPIEVHGPPTVLRTRERDLAAVLDTKQRWAMGMRIFLLVGGGLFLVAMTILMVRSHARDAEATLRELQKLNEGAEREQLEAHVHQARRAALLRGLLMIVMMAGGLACAVLLLESFVWDL
ncbi:MAG: hypothetical protein H6712_34905 [Myxococcales bacterium]|nr:hypothetical protein [Myxococcales bacterium]MCB9719088.1 hypothetical protein [Myxococcales bacterium]